MTLRLRLRSGPPGTHDEGLDKASRIQQSGFVAESSVSPSRFLEHVRLLSGNQFSSGTDFTFVHVLPLHVRPEGVSDSQLEKDSLSIKKLLTYHKRASSQQDVNKSGPSLR